MKENEITGIILDKSLRIHRRLGPGLLESVYERLLAYELEKTGIQTSRQQPIPLVYDEINMDQGYRADLVVDRSVIVEIKSIEELHPVHFKQLLTYLKLADIRVGLLINFGAALLKDGFHRVVNGFEG